jgi:hypothetical protein
MDVWFIVCNYFCSRHNTSVLHCIGDLLLFHRSPDLAARIPIVDSFGVALLDLFGSQTTPFVGSTRLVLQLTL